MGNGFVVLYAFNSLSSQVDFAIGLQISTVEGKPAVGIAIGEGVAAGKQDGAEGEGKGSWTIHMLDRHLVTLGNLFNGP